MSSPDLRSSLEPEPAHTPPPLGWELMHDFQNYLKREGVPVDTPFADEAAFAAFTDRTGMRHLYSGGAPNMLLTNNEKTSKLNEKLGILACRISDRQEYVVNDLPDSYDPHAPEYQGQPIPHRGVTYLGRIAAIKASFMHPDYATYTDAEKKKLYKAVRKDFVDEYNGFAGEYYDGQKEVFSGRNIAQMHEKILASRSLSDWRARLTAARAQSILPQAYHMSERDHLGFKVGNRMTSYSNTYFVDMFTV